LPFTTKSDLRDNYPFGLVATPIKLEKRLSFAVQSALGIICNVRLVGPREIERSEGKAQRVVDKRTQ
jgi:phenylacetate-coenzyme A ligase PaaK-like adenylate-forming protein